MRFRMGVRAVRVYSRQEIKSNRVVFVSRNNVVGIGRDGELHCVGFLLERVLELEGLSIPNLHRAVVNQATIGRVPKFDGSISTSGAKEFAVGREREGLDGEGAALQRVLKL